MVRRLDSGEIIKKTVRQQAKYHQVGNKHLPWSVLEVAVIDPDLSGRFRPRREAQGSVRERIRWKKGYLSVPTAAPSVRLSVPTIGSHQHKSSSADRPCIDLNKRNKEQQTKYG